jgi:hypothetical protein
MDRIIDSDGTVIYPSRSVAYQLGIGRNTMLKLLRQRKVFDRDNIPVLRNRTLFRPHKNDRGDVCTYYTDDGIQYIDRVLHDVERRSEKPFRDDPLPAGLLELLN